MGPPYLSTLTYQYLTQPHHHHEQINLKQKTIIIDGNSFLYFMYDQMLLEDKQKLKQECLTNTPFMHKVYWEKIHRIFKKMRKCSRVTVVFDGIFKSHEDKRPDPQRASSMRFTEFNRAQNRLPILFRREFVTILRKLDMNVHVARGEADPMVASWAKDTNAYVVAADSDYHLFNLPRGYIPLRYLNWDTLTGPNYKMQDVFGNMDDYGVALWASLVAYDYISFEVLENFFSKIVAFDKMEFVSWLEGTNPDKAKRQWITTQWSALRFIQQVGYNKAYNQLIKLVPSKNQDKFNRRIEKYIKLTQPNTIQTRHQKPLHPFLDALYISGDLDRAIIDILISRNILMQVEGNNPVYCQLLLPIAHILLRWDCEDIPINDQQRTIIYREQTYEPLAMINDANLPSLTQIQNMSPEDGRTWLLYCIQYGLSFSLSPITIDNDQIHSDHLFWLCLIKLWYHKSTRESDLRESVLRALIISYLKQTLLHPNVLSECAKSTTNSTILSSPSLLKYSNKKLRKYCSPEIYSSYLQKINSNRIAIQNNERIQADLQEVEQFYFVLCIINQFFKLPLPMPAPSECIDEFCGCLTSLIFKKKDQDNFIKTSVFANDRILNHLLDEILSFVIEC